MLPVDVRLRVFDDCMENGGAVAEKGGGEGASAKLAQVIRDRLDLLGDRKGCSDAKPGAETCLPNEILRISFIHGAWHRLHRNPASFDGQARAAAG